MSHSSSKIKILSDSTDADTDSQREIEVEGSVAGPSQNANTSELPFSAAAGERSTAVWRQWLSSMAVDAEAALAAAMSYREMSRVGRNQWLNSLEEDATIVDVPRVALYAPLLAVEDDPECRQRLILALGEEDAHAPSTNSTLALKGVVPDGTVVHVLSTPLYLDFVQILACGVRAGCFSWVRHDPIVGAHAIPKRDEMVGGARLDEIPFKTALDELALCVLSHKRGGEPLPEALSVLSDFLGAVGP